ARCGPGCHRNARARIANAAYHATLESGGASCPIPSLSNPKKNDTIRIDVATNKEVIDQRRDDILPIGPGIEILLKSRSALPGSVESVDVVAALKRRGNSKGPRGRHSAVTPIGHYDQRPPFCRPVHTEKVAWKRCLLVWEWQPFRAWIKQRRCLLPEFLMAQPVKFKSVWRDDEIDKVGCRKDVARRVHIRLTRARLIAGSFSICRDS